VAADPLIWEQHPNPDRYRREVVKTFLSGALASGGAFLIRERSSGEVLGSCRFYTKTQAEAEGMGRRRVQYRAKVLPVRVSAQQRVGALLQEVRRVELLFRRPLPEPSGQAAPVAQQQVHLPPHRGVEEATRGATANHRRTAVTEATSDKHPAGRPVWKS